MRFVARVRIFPKPALRDPEGEAVRAALRTLGHDVSDVRSGKELLITFASDDEQAARAAAERMGDQLLANPVIENYAVEIEPALEAAPAG